MKHKKINKGIGLIIAAIGFAVNCFANQPIEIPELKNIFDKFKVDGSILI